MLGRRCGLVTILAGILLQPESILAIMLCSNGACGTLLTSLATREEWQQPANNVWPVFPRAGCAAKCLGAAFVRSRWSITYKHRQRAVECYRITEIVYIVILFPESI